MVRGRRCIQKQYIPLCISPYTGQTQLAVDNKIIILNTLNVLTRDF